MFFSSLRTTSFRNLEDAEVFTGAKDVFLVGENGQGKTNFLEALYFCAYASSFRAARDAELARNEFSKTGEKDFSAEVKISQSENDSILVKFENNKKIIFINGKRAEDRRELLSIAPSIVFCHEDMEFVSGSPERRRWFFDQTLSLYDPVYLEDLRRFRKVLKSRNTLLRDYAQGKTSGNPEAVLDALDPQFAMYGAKLMEKREKAAHDFSGVLGPLYEEVSGISGISARYVQSWKGENIIGILQQKRAADMAAGLSLCGPHRDRYQIARNGIEFTGSASTGQKRLLALLLRAAQSRRFSEVTGQKPVLLLDDVLLEMDGEKRRKFLNVLPGYEQAFYTFLPEEPYQRYQKDDTLVYNVNGGKVNK
ncbi:MAG: DNA replication and repair protein RecF [Treponema sp.]|nr:DNA replication and repair protein RecF [Treponema sp.]